MESNIIPFQPELNSTQKGAEADLFDAERSASIVNFPLRQLESESTQRGPKGSVSLYRSEEVQPGVYIEGWGEVTDVEAALVYIGLKNAVLRASAKTEYLKMVGAELKIQNNSKKRLHKRTKILNKWVKEAESQGLKHPQKEKPV